MNAAQKKLVTEIVKAHEATQAELPWERQERAITMTNEEWNKLACYILLTAQHRQEVRESWASLASEYRSAASNAEYWAEMDAFLDRLKDKIDEPYVVKGV